MDMKPALNAGLGLPYGHSGQQGSLPDGYELVACLGTLLVAICRVM